MTSPFEFSDEARVVGAQARVWQRLLTEDYETAECLDDSIARAEELAARFRLELPAKQAFAWHRSHCTAAVPTFAAMAAAAPVDAGLHDALSEQEVEAALLRLDAAGAHSTGKTALDRWDLAIAGTAGLLAGVAGLALVGLPSSRPAQLAMLPRAVRALFHRALPNHTINGMERAYKVPFDASSNRYLADPVAGLHPRSHRFHSLGHDPMLGWVFGVRDVLKGTFTAIGKDGRLICQTTAAANDSGHVLFVRLLEAFRTVGGHMLSDVATPAGLPAPLMPLLQLLQFGSFGEKDRTIADIARFMYLNGYDFRHFSAGCLTTAIVDVIVCASWIARRLDEGSSLRRAMPDTKIPRLRKQLVLGHAMAVAVNAGKIAVCRQPLALNWAQWLAMLRHLGPEISFLLHESGRRAAVEDAMLEADLRTLVARASEAFAEA